jgi:hypothetical protein
MVELMQLVRFSKIAIGRKFTGLACLAKPDAYVPDVAMVVSNQQRSFGIHRRSAACRQPLFSVPAYNRKPSVYKILWMDPPIEAPTPLARGVSHRGDMHYDVQSRCKERLRTGGDGGSTKYAPYSIFFYLRGPFRGNAMTG